METATFGRTSGCVRTPTVSREVCICTGAAAIQDERCSAPFARGSTKLSTAAPRQGEVQGANARHPCASKREEVAVESPTTALQERVQISRVVKVVKGGKGISCGSVLWSSWETEMDASEWAVPRPRRLPLPYRRRLWKRKENIVEVPITKTLTIPHGHHHREGAARLMLRPAAEGTVSLREVPSA
eukprot:jgi/Pico_ML_1/55255/g140.t1